LVSVLRCLSAPARRSGPPSTRASIARIGAIVGAAVWLTAFPGWAQETQRPPGQPQQQPTQQDQPQPSRVPPTPGLPAPPTAEPLPVPQSLGVPSFTSYPLELMGLLQAPQARGSFVVTPSISLSEEYNDNIFLDNNNRVWDFITEMTPALTLLVNRPTYQIAAGYSFTSNYYAKNTRFNDWFDHQNFIGTGVFRPTQQLTLALSERYVKDFNTNLIAPSGTTAGRQEGWSNDVSGGLGYAFTSQTSMNLGGTYLIQHYSGQAVDSEQYGFVGSVTHGFTQRFAAEAT